MRITKKLATGVTAGVLVVAGSGVAFAYWSASGTGTGTSTTGAGTSNLSVVQTGSISGVAPGGQAQTIGGTVTNNAANPAYVTSVTVSITSVTLAQGATGSCDYTDYTLASPTMNVGKEIAAGSQESFSGATIAFNNKTTNQDGCKGATVNLSFAAV